MAVFAAYVPLVLVEVGAVGVDHALAVADENVVLRGAERDQQVKAGNRRGAGAVAGDPRLADPPTGDLERVDDARCRDDRSSMLVIVEDRDLHPGLQLLFDFEAGGGGDILEVDAAERGLEAGDRLNEFIDAGLVDLEIHDVDPGEFLEEGRLALHDGLRSERTDVAEAEDGGAVRDDGDEIGAAGVEGGGGRIGGYLLAGVGDARAVGEREIPLGGHRLRRQDLQLSFWLGRMISERLALEFV